MNVTTSSRWNRAPVGIVRVERSLAEELSGMLGDRLKMCVWSDGAFVEWSASEKSSNEERKLSLKDDEAAKLQPLPWMFPIVSRREAAHALGQGVLSLSPKKFRPFVNRMLYRLRWRLAKIISRPSVMKLRHGLFHAESRARSLPSVLAMGAGSDTGGGEGSIFKRNDILISVGLDWDSDYYKKFYYLRRDEGVKVVTCCYDLIPVLYPQYCVGDVANIFTSYFLEIADGSDLMLCISRQSERDLLSLLKKTGAAIPKTHVFPLGDNVQKRRSQGMPSPNISAVVEAPFILFVSTIERRKNHEVLYRAYHLLAEQGKVESLPKLVFVGMQGWGVGDLMKDIDLDPITKGKILRLNHVSDEDLAVLYENALFCVFPSLYEGWGLPVGEALAAGKVVLSSDRGSLPEVGGDLVKYIDPWSPADWANEISDLLLDKQKISAQEERIRAGYRTRTWVDAASSVAQAIDMI